MIRGEAEETSTEMKYKLHGNEQRSGSQVTLTSYMVGEHCDSEGNHHHAEGAVNPVAERRISESNQQSAKCTTNGCATKNGTAVLDLPEENYLQHRHLPSCIVKPTVKEWIKDRIKKGCRKKVLFKRVPILSWLPQYNFAFAISDFVAGLTVGLTVIPQAIAYSNVAGLPPQVGLYSSFMACFVYTIFGSCRDAPIGPTAIGGLLTRENNHGMGIPGAVLLTFLSGCVEFLMGVLQLGKSNINNQHGFLILVAYATIQKITGVITPAS
ncbi:hypothetical protein NQ318_007900 [Aromia moschata]|uniref:SLC26A/SulP transporter domain-containing protein n=1 Tax=Aromia moschata TaxID=1265417 RepID=A0AAV8XW28_9CUCU|nr:hypothetical protein NQ318_007900 [Aromia moschata]